MSTRQERDSIGPIDVPADKYWGAQTQRSTQNFKIGGIQNQMPIEVIRAFAFLKKGAAITNHKLGVLDGSKKREDISPRAIKYIKYFNVCSQPTAPRLY